MRDSSSADLRSLAELIAFWRAACQRSDVAALATAYEDSALMVTSCGEVLEGKERLYEGLLEALDSLPCAGRGEIRRSLEGDGIAILINAWLYTEDQQATDISTGGLGLMIARRQPDGRWLIAIDAPHGTI